MWAMKQHHIRYTILFVSIIILTVGVLAFFVYARGERTVMVTPSTTITFQTPEIPQTITTPFVCNAQTLLASSSDQRWCDELPLINRTRLFQIDLTHNVILFFQDGVLQKTFPVAYQAPYGKWFQTPTGFFEIGVKREKFMSSIFPVWMEHAVQLYEDFFIHAIPYYQDGTRVTSKFSGGCIRLQDAVAQDFYNTVQRGDSVVSYLSLNDAQTKEGFISPVATSSFWIRQRFNSPLKSDWSWYEDKQFNYIQHTGVDFAPKQDAKDLSVYALASSTVEQIFYNGKDDGGLGNTIILSFDLQGEKKFALYGHLASINPAIFQGKQLQAGDVLGVVGNTGYGCNYWRVGEDGCDATGDPDIHTHIEIKDSPVLASPISDECTLPSGKKTQCIGSTSGNPTAFGYEDPIGIIFSSGVVPQSSEY